MLSEHPTVNQCQQLLHSGRRDISEGQFVLAAFTLMEDLRRNPHSEVRIDDGLVLLNQPGVICEAGARILYVLTGRGMLVEHC